MLASKIWTYIRIAVLIVLPSAAILPWLLLLTQGARDRKFLSNVNIQAVAQITDDMKVSELANRVTAYSSTVLLVVLALAAGVLALWSIWKSGLQSGAKAWPPWHWSPVLQVWLVWFGALAVYVALRSPQVLELFGDGFNTNTVARIDARLIEILRSQFYVSTIGAAFAGTALAAAATDIGQEARALPNPPNAQQVDDLSRRLDLVLFATAAVLVAGVIAVDTWSAWPSPLVGGKDATIAGREAQAAARDELRPKNVAVDNPSDSNAAAQVEALKQKKLEDLKNNYAAFLELKNGFIAIQSVCYVGALVLIFLPAAASIDSARRRLAGLSGPTMFKVDQILRVLAILSPVLVGPITRFLAVKLGIGG